MRRIFLIYSPILNFFFISTISDRFTIEHVTGLQIRDDSTVYTGHVKHGKIRHGLGTLAHTEGGTHTGQWRNGRMHGLGVLNWIDGCSYFGNYVKNKKVGPAIFTNQNGSRDYTEWADDVEVGEKQSRGWF